MTANMTNPTQRITRSPERLDLGGRTYSQESACAMTFLFVGKVVATSARPHAFIINGVKKMASHRDLKTARSYELRFSSPPDAEDHAEFMAKWTGALGVTRERTKAGRIWKDVPDGNGGTVSVISFWGPRRSIRRADIDLLATVFGVKGRLWVEAIDARAPGRYCMPGPHDQVEGPH